MLTSKNPLVAKSDKDIMLRYHFFRILRSIY